MTAVCASVESRVARSAAELYRRLPTRALSLADFEAVLEDCERLGQVERDSQGRWRATELLELRYGPALRALGLDDDRDGASEESLSDRAIAPGPVPSREINRENKAQPCGLAAQRSADTREKGGGLERLTGRSEIPEGGRR